MRAHRPRPRRGRLRLQGWRRAHGTSRVPRTVDQLIVFGSNAASLLGAGGQPAGARGDGQPITTLIELEAGTSRSTNLPARSALIAVAERIGRATASWPRSPTWSRAKGGKGLHHAGRGRDGLRAVARAGAGLVRLAGQDGTALPLAQAAGEGLMPPVRQRSRRRPMPAASPRPAASRPELAGRAQAPAQGRARPAAAGAR